MTRTDLACPEEVHLATSLIQGAHAEHTIGRLRSESLVDVIAMGENLARALRGLPRA